MGQPLNLSDILKKIKDNKPSISSFGVKTLGVFGSYIKDEQNSSSDLDILVEFETGQKSFDNLIGLLNFLEDLFNMKVDLVTKEALSPHIGPSILNEVIYVEQ